MRASNAVIWFAAIGLFFSTDVVVAADSRDATLVMRTTPDAIELAVPVSALVLQFPKGGLAEVKEARSGAQASPRYFHLADGRGLIVSGWFESAQTFDGFETFWKGEFSAMKKAGLVPTAPPTSVVLGDWSGAAYELPLPDGAPENMINTHIRAELIKAGTWIDLHISITSRKPVAEARDEALAFLKSIAVKVKQ
jgi:hypothetical protein